ncbi:MAG: TIGR03943 family putative permease subunit [Candidatus Ratteibacteria bacterium]
MKVLKNKYFYEFLIFLFYILFFLSLCLTGNFKVFVKKFYFPYILIGTLILFFLLVINFKAFKKFKEISVYEIISFIIFLFPMIIFLIVRPTTLPTYAALKRGIKTEFLSQDILKSLQEKIEIEGKYKKLTIKQILAFSKSKPDEINEKDVLVEGMVYKGEEKNKFTLIRFLITCCAVDATCLGVEVEYENTKEFKNEDWVKVKGKAKVENGKVKIYAINIEKINPPSDPYLY